jgi:hypothetical protein
LGVNPGGISAIAVGIAVTALATAAFVYKVRKAQQAAQQAKKGATKATPRPLQVASINAVKGVAYAAAGGAVATIRPPVPTNTVRINPAAGAISMAALQSSVQREKVSMSAQPARSAMQSVRTGAGSTNAKQTFVNVSALESYNRLADMKSFQATQARNLRTARSVSVSGTPRKPITTRLTGVGIDL